MVNMKCGLVFEFEIQFLDSECQGQEKIRAKWIKENWVIILLERHLELKLIALQLIFAFLFRCLFRCGKRRIRKKGGVWQ